MSRRIDATSLQLLLDRAQEVVGFARGRNLDDLRTDRMLGLAIQQLLVMIGVGARRLPLGLRNAHPEVSWREIMETGDALIVDYDEVEIETVWRTATEDIPKLVATFERLLP